MAFNVLLPSKLRHLSPFTAQYISLLESYTKTRSVVKIEQLHAQIITSGILCCVSNFNSNILRSNLASSYGLCGCVSYARKLFDEMPKPKLFLYNAIIRMYSQNGSSSEVLRLFVNMLSSGNLFPDNFTYPFVIKACGDLLLLKNGVLVHAKAITGGFGSNIFVLNSLLAMYMNCGEMEMSRRVFSVMGERDVVSWATMISGFLRNRCPNDAMLIFDEMMDKGIELNSSSLVSVISSCGNLENFALGRKVHAIVEEKGLQIDISVWNALIDMYAKCGYMDEAQKAFKKMKEKDVVTWTTMINGHVLNGDSRNAFELCWLMHLEGVIPNPVTIAMLLQACALSHALEQGRCLHAWVIRRKIFNDAIIATSLINMYVNCNRMCLSFQVFNQCTEKRVAVWNSMISGYMHKELAREAILCFKHMLNEAVNPDIITFSSVLPAYANLADMWQACNIHAYLINYGFLSKSEILTGLVDLYSKCGNLESSHKIFSEGSQKSRDITLWSALIAGYGAHGHGKVAISLFKHMIQSGVEPNEVTFTCVLDACSHAGLVDEGFDLFKLMLKESQSRPSMYHYTCMVDLLGRAGRLKEAYDLVMRMPCQPNHAIWGALLGACVAHEKVEFGEIAAKSLIELEPENAGNYVLLANIYATAGRWEDAANIRSMINHVRSGKTPGHSSVEVIVT